MSDDLRAALHHIDALIGTSYHGPGCPAWKAKRPGACRCGRDSALFAAAEFSARAALYSAPALPPEPEWVVNDNAELGVKVGERFYFLYKGRSLVYSGTHDDGTPMHWRPVGKREFGECCHPYNLNDPTKYGTVSLDDSDEWEVLPAAPPAPALPVAPEGEPDVPRALFLERWPEESGREDTIHYEPTGYGDDLAGHTSEIHEYRLVAPAPAEDEERDAALAEVEQMLTRVVFTEVTGLERLTLSGPERDDWIVRATARKALGLVASEVRALRAAKQEGGR